MSSPPLLLLCVAISPTIGSALFGGVCDGAYTQFEKKLSKATKKTEMPSFSTPIGDF